MFEPTPLEQPSTQTVKWEELEQIYAAEMKSIQQMTDMPLSRWAEWAEDHYKRSCSDDDGVDEPVRKEGKKAR